MALSNCDPKIDGQQRELTPHGDTRFPIACYHSRLMQDRVPWHWHDEWEAFLVERGTAAVFVDGQSYTLRSGEGIFINASVLHSVRDAGATDCRLHSVVYHPRLVGGGVESIFWESFVEPLLSRPQLKCVLLTPSVPWEAEALRYIETAYRTCAEESPGYELDIRAALSRLSFLLVDHFPAARIPPAEKTLRSSQRIKDMLTFVHRRYRETLTTAAIAQSANISESECLRCFRAMLHTTPMQYVRQFRLQKAAELLKTTDLKIAEIGALCGFQEMSYFTKTFREAAGCTPTAYRAAKRRPPAAQ